MDDRKLLELAAKAAGLSVSWGEEFSVGGYIVDCTDMLLIEREQASGWPEYWNPLTDDNDAFRLAATLDMEISFRGGGEHGAVQANGTIIFVVNGDKMKAAREAIVYVAAEIGKAT